MIETRLLHYFLAIAREQNITKAGRISLCNAVYFIQADDGLGKAARKTAFYPWKEKTDTD